MMFVFKLLCLYILFIYIELTSSMCLWNYDASYEGVLQFNGDYQQISSETHNNEIVYTQQNAESCTTVDSVLPFKLYKFTGSDLWTLSKVLDDLSYPWCQCQSSTISDCMVGGSATWNCRVNISPFTMGVSMGIYGNTCPSLTECKSLHVKKLDTADTTSTCADGTYYKYSTQSYTYYKEIKAVEVDNCDNTYMMFIEKGFVWMELSSQFWEAKPDPNGCNITNWLPLSRQMTAGWSDLINGQAVQIPFTIGGQTSITFTFNCSDVVSNSPVLAPTNHPTRPLTIPPTKNPIGWVPGTPSLSPIIPSNIPTKAPSMKGGNGNPSSPTTNDGAGESHGYYIKSNIYGISLIIVILYVILI